MRAIYFVDKEWECVIVDRCYFEEIVAVRNMYNVDITIFEMKDDINKDDFKWMAWEELIGNPEEIIESIKEIRLLREVI